MKWRAVEFEYKIRNKINYNFSPREARRIRFVFLSLSKNCAVRNLEKGYFPFFSPKISTSSLLVWLCWAGWGKCYLGLVVDELNRLWVATDSGLALAAPVNDWCLFLWNNNAFQKSPKLTHFSCSLDWLCFCWAGVHRCRQDNCY